ncbi:DUF1398 domain-containing protein [Microvirga pudoricolor]|uniref:DUF1398 domain-containing protein n=1 Tax=Microvirga pudoricolor TaxID=2778729 RepID=UPI001951E5E8|nr:DUF1398 family protein [Microvirga pudoricolor]MBM6593364.1 DUF1398 family protein [Microvirga pudoricolor]
MNQSVKTVVEECTRASDEERVAFPQVVMKLMDAGVERYHADLVRSEKTYYMPDDASHAVPNASVGSVPAKDFSSTGVEAAVRAIQAGRIRYKEFCERIAMAGCVGYHVSLAGRRAVYYGRTGDSYVEPFPAAPAP